MSYQKKTGCLSQGAHPGSYNGQDVYNDMLITVPERERESMGSREWSDAPDTPTEESRIFEHDARPDNYTGGYVARRLTPTECARLQGFPPDWCADVPHSDSAEYKLWGNGIALPTIIPMLSAAKSVIENNKH